MDKRTTNNDRQEGNDTINICDGHVDKANFDVVDSFRRTFDELSDFEQDGSAKVTATDANGRLTTNAASHVEQFSSNMYDLFYTTVAAESVDALSLPPTHYGVVGAKDSMLDSGLVDNESEANYLDNASNGEVTAPPSNAATIFRYHRSTTMSVFSAAAALSTNAIETASPFDKIVATFVPHAAAEEEEEEEAQPLENTVDKTLVAEKKAVPSIQQVATCTSSSSFESSTDSNDEEIALESELPIDREGEEEKKAHCPRSMLFWIAISLVGALLISFVPIILAIANKYKIDDEEGALMTESIIQDSPETHDQQMPGHVASGHPQEAKVPTLTPTESNEPSDVGSIKPSASSSPSILPSRVPSGYPTASPFKLFNYGESLYTNYELGIQLSEGLNAKLIAQKNSRVKYADGSESTLRFHEWLDGAGVAPLPDGGYVYMSNSEDDAGKGGVFGLYFDKDGGITNYKALLSGTTWNCGGGMTPWNTWLSCEETSTGQCWQVDPNPESPYHLTPKKTLLGGPTGGNYESVAVDNTNVLNPVFFTTEDNSRGELRRFVADGNGWDSLHEGGVTTYLEFLDENKFRWTSSLSAGENSASRHYPNSEGIAYHNNTLYFVSKTIKTIFMLNMNDMTFTSERTGSNFQGQGSFNAQPDQIVKTIHDNDDRKYTYFTEEGGTSPGAHARDSDGMYYTLFRGIPGGKYKDDETVGIAFSPDRRRFYCGYQDEGVLFEITQEDGLMFN